ncbi:Putative ribonuclease H protein At1g65750 [Linum perenne]
MQATQDLGRYLGVPIIHGRNSKNLYRYLVERIENRLAGWKVGSLSFAGRVSLATSVLNTIPTYTMQTTLLPNEICENIDKKIRSFIWGSINGERKLHLLKWEKICQPKDRGGLGIRSAKELNHAFLMKLIWGMLKNPEALWVRVLRTKYLQQTSNGLEPKKSKRWSACWKGINESWPIFTGGLCWNIQNGKKTNFWKERWLDDGTIIGDSVQPPQGQEDRVIADFCDSSGAWDVNRLAGILPMSILQSVVGMTPPCPDLGDDSPVWGLEPNGCYSVKSGYILARNMDEESNNEIWKRIWKWEGPQRVRQFLWLALHNRLLTNAERHRRHLTDTAECGACANDTETVDHILRGCPMAQQVWMTTLSIPQSDGFFSMELDDWWKANLGKKEGSIGFGITCWLLWKARNERIFEGKMSTVTGIVEQRRFWVNITTSAYRQVADLRNTRTREGTSKDISWKVASGSGFTLNTDGSVRRTERKAATGGCLRDAEGRVIDAFVANLGNCSITRAELTGVVLGLERAWEKGIRKLEVQTDSACAVQLLAEGVSDSHQHGTLVRKFKLLFERDWEVSVKFIYREANHLADYLANKGHEMALGIHTIENSDSGILYWAMYDLVGGSESRRIFE